MNIENKGIEGSYKILENQRVAAESRQRVPSIIGWRRTALALGVPVAMVGSSLFGKNEPSQASAQVVGECYGFDDESGNKTYLYYRGNGLWIDCNPDQIPTATPVPAEATLTPTPLPEAPAPEATPVPTETAKPTDTILPTATGTPQPQISGECIAYNSPSAQVCTRQESQAPAVVYDNERFRQSQSDTQNWVNSLNPRASVNNSGNSHVDNCSGVNNCSPSAYAQAIVINRGGQPGSTQPSAPTEQPTRTPQTEPRVTATQVQPRPTPTFQPRPSMP